MTVCKNCNSVEPETKEYELDGETFTGCAVCGIEEETLVNYNEDDPREDR